MHLTRLFFSTDIHGSEKCFKKFVNAATFYKTNCIIMGGDITAKMIVTVVKETDGSYTAKYLGGEYTARNDAELRALEDRIRYVGYIPYLTNPDEVSDLQRDPKGVDELFRKLITAEIENWLKIAEERLKGTDVKCFILPGNDDRLEVDDLLEKSSVVVNPEGKVLRIDDDHEMISTGYANITPWNCPRDIPEDELAAKIEKMADKVGNMKNCIFTFHCPPIQSGLDDAPKLDADFRPVVRGGQMIMESVGSTAVRGAIMKYQPLLGLHGHIHEARGVTKIGRTICINPGSEYSEGILRGVVVNLGKDEVKSHLLVAG
jgi:Icc-related predicted phosphoesterase